MILYSISPITKENPPKITVRYSLGSTAWAANLGLIGQYFNNFVNFLPKKTIIWILKKRNSESQIPKKKGNKIYGHPSPPEFWMPHVNVLIFFFVPMTRFEKLEKVIYGRPLRF